MKKHLKQITLLASISAAASLNAAIVLVDFNNTNDLTDNFSTLDTGGLYTNVATGGLSNSGSIAPGTDSQIWTYDTSFAGTDSNTLSAYFQWDGAQAGRGLSLGYATDTGDYRGNGGPRNAFYTTITRASATELNLGTYSDDNTGSNAALVSTQTSNRTVVDGNWYFFEVDITYDGSNEYTVVSQLFESDGVTANGGTLTRTFTNATIAGDATVHSFFGGQSGSDILSSIDNVTMAVPEPSAYALISGFLALGWIMVRRRK